jgi:hypothetical protein
MWRRPARPLDLERSIFRLRVAPGLTPDGNGMILRAQVTSPSRPVFTS